MDYVSITECDERSEEKKGEISSVIALKTVPVAHVFNFRYLMGT